MSLLKDINNLRSDRKTNLDAAGAILTRASRAKRALTGEEKTEWERRMTDGENQLDQITRLERQHTAELSTIGVDPAKRMIGREDTVRGETPPIGYQRGGGRQVRTGQIDLSDPEALAFRVWMAGGLGMVPTEQRAVIHAALATMPAEVRDGLSGVTGSAGAYGIPQGFVYQLDVALKQFGGIIEAADYIDTDSGATMPYPTFNDTGNLGEITAENTAVTGSPTGSSEVDPTFGVINYSAYMFDSGIVKVPMQLVMDFFTDIGQVMADALQERVGRKLNNKCTLGAGSNSSEPKGIVTAATLGYSGASPTSFTYSEILELEHSVDPMYRRQTGCGFMFNDTTLKKVKQLVDGNSRPLFIAGGVSEGIQNRSPDTLNGYPIYINQDMASPGSSAKCMLFGAFKKYKIRRVGRPYMQKFNERFMDLLQLAYLVFARYDGNLVDAGTHPVKYLSNSAT